MFVRVSRGCQWLISLSFTGRARGPAATASEIERNVALGLAAADQQIASGRRLDWVRPVGDGAENQSRLAVVTNSGAARPAHRHIARLGQFEQAVECGAPVDSEIAARKGDKRPDLRGFRRRIGSVGAGAAAGP